MCGRIAYPELEGDPYRIHIEFSGFDGLVL